MEEADKENHWSNHNRPYRTDQLRSSSPPHTITNSQLHQNSLHLHATVAETVSAGSDGGTKHPPKYVVDVADDGGENHDVLALRSKKNDPLRHQVINTIEQGLINTSRLHYQRGSSFHPIVFEPVQLPEAQPKPPVQSAFSDSPESADKKTTEDKEEKCEGAEHGSVFATVKQKNGEFRQIFDETDHCRTVSPVQTSTVAPSVQLVESFPTCTSPVPRPATSPSKPADEDCKVDRVACLEVEEEPAPDYDDDDDDDDVFTSTNKNNEDIRHVANGRRPNGVANNWGAEVYRKYQLDTSANMAVGRDDHFPITSSVSTSGIGGRDAYDVCSSNGNGKRNGILQLQYTCIYCIGFYRATLCVARSL